MADTRPPTIDLPAALRWERAAPPDSPWLHEEVARRMEDRLQWIRLQPRTWVHWDAVRGGMQAHGLLARRYPQADCFVVQPQPAGAGAHGAARALVPAALSLARWRGGRTRVAEPADGTAQMLWANMALHMAADPQALIARWHQALAVDGFVMFSALGPDTLRELRPIYQAMGWPPPAHEFTDMHDWGDMLVHGGFAEPVMDMERIVLTWDSPQRLLAELRGLGANLHRGRFAGLRGRRWKAALEHALAAGLARPDEQGRLALTFEVIYGHALKAAPRLRVSEQSAVSLQDMRFMLRTGRGSP
ncbi:MAG: biotin synthase [Proteobacteria bacterium]|nr:biotin synthase [Pseudomonadota bacterium]